jgi:hypothetical protein
MYSSYTHFGKLKACVVGRSYSPEFYSWIKNTRLRTKFEQIAQETEEDYLSLCILLKSFGVEVIRPDVPDYKVANSERIPGPYSMTPRDSLCMIGEKLYRWDSQRHIVKASSLRDWAGTAHVGNINVIHDPYIVVEHHVAAQGNQVIRNPALQSVQPNGIYRLGDTLIIGTSADVDEQPIIDCFPDYKIYTAESDGHIDGAMSIPCPGLILSINDFEVEYNKLYPDWEVCYLGNTSFAKVQDWRKLKMKNGGKWWLPDASEDDELVDLVEHWLSDWVGYVEETVFDVNILSVDEKNVIVSGYNETAFRAFEKHGITPHITPWRHRFFWDGGIHCITLDLDREDSKKDYITL